MILLWRNIGFILQLERFQHADSCAVDVSRNKGNPDLPRLGKVLELLDEPVTLSLFQQIMSVHS
jgi:hypothetical protein